MIVRCTKKMPDLLGGRSLTLSELSPTDDDWYLNLFWIDRQNDSVAAHTCRTGPPEFANPRGPRGPGSMSNVREGR